MSRKKWIVPIICVLISLFLSNVLVQASISPSGHSYSWMPAVDRLAPQSRSSPDSLGSWNYTSSLSIPRYTHGVAAWGNHIYVLGGENSTGRLSSIEVTTTNSNGSLGEWHPMGALPSARTGLKAIAVGGYLYVLGGRSSSGQILKSVDYASINPDGTLGEWHATSPMTTERLNLGVVSAGNYLYAIGGLNQVVLNSVEYAPINADGTLGAWQTTNNLGTARHAMDAVLVNGTIYVPGGHNATGNKLGSVEYATIQADGSLGAWSITSAMNTARAYHAVVTDSSFVYMIGGSAYSSNTSIKTVEQAAILENHTLGPWQIVNNLNQDKFGIAAAFANGNIYVTGGHRLGMYLTSVEWARAQVPVPTPLPPAPTPTVYPTPTPQPTPDPTVHYPVLLVHGWLGLDPGGRDCALTAAPFDDTNPQHADWVEVANRLIGDGFSVYVASLQSSLLYTPPLQENAACLKRQVASVKSQSHQDKVILIGHSMGGLVSRIYMEDASLYQDDAARLITLGSPHGGADYPAALIHLFPWSFSATCLIQPPVCQFTNPGVKVANLTYHARANNVPYTLIGGTWISPRSLSLLMAEGPNDSVVGRASATGRYWPLGTAVGGSQVQRLQTSSDHGGYFTGATRYACIRRGLGLSGDCADADALSDDLHRTDETILSGHTQDLVGSVQAGQVVSHTVTVDTSEHSIFMLSWLNGTLAYTLTNPSGTLITPAYAAANPGVVSYTAAAASGEQPAWAAYAFTQTLSGPWTLWVGGADTPPAGSSYHTSAWMETTRTLAAGANHELYQAGSTATLTATLQSDDSGLAGATVQAILPRTDGITDTVTLTDMGAGNYQASYPIPDAPGYVYGRVVATGSDGGTMFDRQTELVFAIASQAAELNGSYAIRTPDINTDGRYDALLVDMEVVATEPVTMSFSADLEPSGIAETLRAVTTTVLATGTQTVTLEFPGRDIHRVRSSGPYTVTNVLLHDLSLGGVLAQAADNVHVTELYDYRQFGLRGDIDNSCEVDLFDIMAVTLEWGVTTFNPDVDLDRDDRVSVRDIMLVTSRWNGTCWN